MIIKTFLIVGIHTQGMPILYAKLNYSALLKLTWISLLGQVRESWMRPITCMIRERQMRLYGHVARFPVSDPAGRILSAREPAGRTRPVGRPHDT